MYLRINLSNTTRSHLLILRLRCMLNVSRELLLDYYYKYVAITLAGFVFQKAPLELSRKCIW